MKKVAEFVLNRLVAGALVVVPICLASLLLLKAVNSLMPIVAFLLILCLLMGFAARTPVGRTTWEQIEKSLFESMPVYGLFRSLSFAPHLLSGVYMYFRKSTIILIILLSGFARADTTFGPSRSEQENSAR
jgi:uncharacterized membrane protein